MANATAKVSVATVPWGDDKIERTTQFATATIYYPGQMMALTSAGVADHAGDTAGYKFDGINAESDRVQTFGSGDGAGRPVKVERPWRFVMTIAAAAAGDEGKAVYALDNQTVAYGGGVTNNVLVGWVDQVLSATAVLIQPVWSAGFGLGGGTGGREALLTLSGASDAIPPHTAADYVVTTAGVDAMTLAAPTTGVDDGKIISIASATANAHTITATGLIEDGGTTVNVATFGAHAGASVKLMAYAAKWIVLSSNAITFS